LVCQPYERQAVESLLAAEGYVIENEPYLDSARWVREEPKPLGSSLAASFGLLYILDKSSMLPPLFLRPGLGATVLDLCASPGSKTGILAEMVGEKGLVVANEPKKKRYQTLRQNMQQLNLFQVVGTGYQAEAYPGLYLWDKILLDVPCSGWGTAEKNPKVLSVWREDNIRPLLILQRHLLTRAAELLAPGGRLIYSTCTTNRQENEDQVLWAQAKLGLGLESLTAVPGFVFDPVQDAAAKGTLRVNGPASQGQSFFMAGLAKPGQETVKISENTMQNQAEIDPDVLARLKIEANWQRLPPGRVTMEGEWLVFRPALAMQVLHGVSWQGMILGRGRKGLRLFSRMRKLVPPPQSGSALVLDNITDLYRLLQGQSLPAPGPGPLAGLYWNDLPLGWVAIKGNRCLWTDR
jgi:16S rRNA (cytosine1407-C5)-methyltransferase